MIAVAIVWYFIGALAGLVLFLIGAEAVRDAIALVRRVDARASREDEELEEFGW